MTVRLAEPKDIARVLEIEKHSFPTPSDSEFLQKLSNDIFLVFEEEEIYGYLIAGCCHHNITASILKVAVHPDHRSKGVATELFHQLFEILKDRQIDEVDVIVDALWKPAISLYKKVGFETASTVPLLSDDNSFRLMIRKL
jgi:ribosomal-protein-alanine N-acetyltransferase